VLTQQTLYASAPAALQEHRWPALLVLGKSSKMTKISRNEKRVQTAPLVPMMRMAETWHVKTANANILSILPTQKL
jgi:hypothetical protein